MPVSPRPPVPMTQDGVAPRSSAHWRISSWSVRGWALAPDRPPRALDVLRLFELRDDAVRLFPAVLRLPPARLLVLRLLVPLVLVLLAVLRPFAVPDFLAAPRPLCLDEDAFFMAISDSPDTSFTTAVKIALDVPHERT